MDQKNAITLLQIAMLQNGSFYTTASAGSTNVWRGPRGPFDTNVGPPGPSPFPSFAVCDLTMHSMGIAMNSDVIFRPSVSN